ncbi:glycosyl hydrolase [Aestuariibacter sp. GS-14]|uniref:glycosyl hydrolase n=1 Tax=Aestuariibacter sp. GS-14 TaxID=2590670 RepID=UPI0015E83B4B|nr:glycosyl hydrolase [Aestuariibacter sp. GS-14]
MFRWWLPAAKVEDRVLIKQLEAIADAGFKGVEICIHMGDTHYTREQMRTHGWGTQRWNEVYKRILTTANDLGLQVDTTISPAWPAAVPTIVPTDNAASKELLAGTTAAFRGTFSGVLPDFELSKDSLMPPPPGAPQNEESGEQAGPNNMYQSKQAKAENPPVLVAVTAARIVGSANIVKPILMAWGDMPHNVTTKQREALLIDPESVQVITNFHRDATGQYSLNWQAPDEGEWKIFTFWMRGSEQQNKEGVVTYEPNYVVDHLSVDGADALISFWEKTLLDDKTRQLLRLNGGAIFEDSLELDYRGLVWTAGFLETFNTQRGYDLTPYLPLLIGSRVNGLSNDSLNQYEFADSTGNYSNTGDRIRTDFKETLTHLYIENHIKPLQTWASGIGQSYRVQAYGLGVDIVKAAAVAAGPDGESLGFGPSNQGDDRFRMVAGGAHIGGHSVVADEVGAIANEGYRLTWLEMLKWINKNMAAGANQMVFHGMGYPDSNQARWPGVSPFGFGLAGYWGPRNPDWQHIDQLAKYLSRAQGAMQSGVAKIDLAILNLQYGTSAPVVIDKTLTHAGYSYDILTPGAITELGMQVTDGRLLAEGPAYKALIVYKQATMSLETIERLTQLADAKLPIIFVGQLPAGTPFFNNYPHNDDLLKSALKKLLAYESVSHVNDMKKLFEQLKVSQISPNLLLEEPLPVVVASRQNGSAQFHFIHYTGENKAKGNLIFKEPGIAYEMDLWTGVITALEKDKQQRISIYFEPEQARLLFTIPEALPEVMVTRQTGKLSKQLVLSDWSLVVQRWQENRNTPQPSDTVISTIRVGNTSLVPWLNIPQLGEQVSGVGLYETNFTLGKSDLDYLPVLMLNAINDSSSLRIKVNGQPADLNYDTLEASLAGLVHQGENTLQIEVSSPLGNQLLASGDIKAPPWDPGFELKPERYGLDGPVTIRLFNR